jgi:hypothetical protein
MEARVGIEPALTDLQSAALPLCHRALEKLSRRSLQRCCSRREVYACRATAATVKAEISCSIGSLGRTAITTRKLMCCPTSLGLGQSLTTGQPLTARLKPYSPSLSRITEKNERRYTTIDHNVSSTATISTVFPKMNQPVVAYSGSSNNRNEIAIICKVVFTLAI